MQFWTTFAKTGTPGISSNAIKWEKYSSSAQESKYIILDKRKNLKMASDFISFESLKYELQNDKRLSDLEKCVVLLQMFTYVGDDLYDENINNYPGKCDRNLSEKFLVDNASFIEY